MANGFQTFKQTWALRLLGFWKIPLLGSLLPTVVVLDEAHCVVRIRLWWWTRNHLGSMYFGTLAMGADGAGGLLAVDIIRRRKARVALVFKGFQAEFLKRPEADVYFICEEGTHIGAMVDRVVATGARLTEPIQVVAAIRTPEGGYEPVARFVLELSLKPSNLGVL